jgi:hypothetical protein
VVGNDRDQDHHHQLLYGGKGVCAGGFGAEDPICERWNCERWKREQIGDDSSAHKLGTMVQGGGAGWWVGSAATEGAAHVPVRSSV